jgi:cytochrome c553
MLPRLSAQLRGAAVGAVLAVLPTSPPPLGAHPASAPTLVLECAPCHGFDGVGQDDDVPNLAGQHRAHLDRQVLAAAAHDGIRR